MHTMSDRGTVWRAHKLNRYLAGAVAGVIATALMTVGISAGKLAGLLRTPPPEQVTKRVTDRAGLDTDAPEPEFTAGSLLAHHAFGASGGVAYALIRQFLPASATLAGLVFGGLIWMTAYLGYLPLLRLYPWPDDDRRSRMAVMIAAHAVYGVTLASADKRLAE